MDRRAYLDRIRVTDVARPDLDGLRMLHEHHLYAAPFENLDIYCGVPIVLDLERILDKIVTRRRGGFCYELNGAFHWLLTELGYDVTMLSAEVVRPDGTFGIPFDHMALRVVIEDEPWLVDVGFGDSFLHPIPLDEQADGDYRLTRADNAWTLVKGDEAKYRFTLEPRRLEDYAGGCAYHQTSAESTFTQRVVTTRATRGGRLTLTRERFIVHRGTERTESTIASDDEWRRALDEHFDISLESIPCEDNS